MLICWPRRSQRVLAAVPHWRALGHYRANRDGRAVAMYDFTVSLAALHRRSSLPLLLHALAGRPDEIDRLLATFAGVVPVDRYFSVRNLLPLLGPARMLRVAMRDRRRTRPPSWDGEMAADGNDRWAPNSRIPLRAASGSHRPSVARLGGHPRIFDPSQRVQM